MKGDREFVGTLMGFDDYVSESMVKVVVDGVQDRDEWLMVVALVLIDMVLKDVTE
jgi:small nuclear ribonucleoprotein (snRNP)-like protein